MRRPHHWTALAASVAGSSHRKASSPCQDAAKYRSVLLTADDQSFLVAAIADGAGSAPLSSYGSAAATTVAVCSAVAALQATPEPDSPFELTQILQHAHHAALTSIQHLALQSCHQPADYATTLITAIATPKHVAYAQIGDGAIVIGESGLPYALLTSPDNGEYANYTSFITSSNAADRMQLGCHSIRQRPLQLAMFTDGLQHLLIDHLGSTNATPHQAFFQPTFHWFSQQQNEYHAYLALRDLLTSDTVTNRTSDDATLFLAISPSPPR